MMSLRPKKQKQRGLSRKDLQRIHDKRTQKAQDVDESLQASMAPSLAAWVKDPAKYDVSGIDFPEEWRTKDEIERLKDLDESLPIRQKELEAMKRQGDNKMTANLEASLKLFKETQDLLRWQKKHPFISAGVDADPAGYGKKNYEAALKHKIDYGFNLRDPENSFLHNYHLKKHDIKGMRVILERLVPPGAPRAWYNRVTKLFHQLPILGDEKKEHTDKTILHEIGHHVMFSSSELWSHWAGQYYVFSSPSRVGTRYTGEIRRVHLYPYELIYDYHKYFGSTVYFKARYNWWRGQYLSKSALKESSLDTKWRRGQEFWAETFTHYRLGNISREVKMKKVRIDLINKDIKRHNRQMREHKGPKNRKPYTTLKKEVKQLELARVIASAQYDNLLKLDRMLKRWDRRGWNPDYDVEMKMR